QVPRPTSTIPRTRRRRDKNAPRTNDHGLLHSSDDDFANPPPRKPRPRQSRRAQEAVATPPAATEAQQQNIRVHPAAPKRIADTAHPEQFQALAEERAIRLNQPTNSGGLRAEAWAVDSGTVMHLGQLGTRVADTGNGLGDPKRARAYAVLHHHESALSGANATFIESIHISREEAIGQAHKAFAQSLALEGTGVTISPASVAERMREVVDGDDEVAPRLGVGV
ncbi:hypothetical protein LTR74_018837, partial [Friedmanniomyces endolithicus]